MQTNNQSTKKIKRRIRDPVPPSFALPPKGDLCKNWLPFGKRELTSRAKLLNQQRLEVMQIMINRTVLIVFTFFSLAVSDNISFEFDTHTIISELIKSINPQLLSNWTGPRFRGNGYKSKKWEGKNGYYKLCKNWFDQNKYRIAHSFWIPVFEQLLSFIDTLAYQQFTNDQTLQMSFKQCLTYGCLYSICSSKVGFPKARVFPLFLDTAIAKNIQIRKYLRSFDSGLHIYKFKEEESERYNRERKICEAVKERCTQYLAQMIQIKFDELHKLSNLCGDIGQVKAGQFTFSIKYGTDGQIGRQTNNSENKIKSKTAKKERKESISVVRDQCDSRQNIMDINDIMSMNEPSLPPSPLPISPLYSGSNHSYIPSEYDSLPYSGARGQIRNVEQIRHTPYNYSLPAPVPYYYDFERAPLVRYPMPYHNPYYNAYPPPCMHRQNRCCVSVPCMPSQPVPAPMHYNSLCSDISSESVIDPFISGPLSVVHSMSNTTDCDNEMMARSVYAPFNDNPYTTQPFTDNSYDLPQSTFFM